MRPGTPPPAHRTAERIAQGLCPKRDKQPPAPELSVCAPCAEKKRVAGRVRDTRLRTAGKPRRDLGRARAYEREHRRRQTDERLIVELGLDSRSIRDAIADDRARRCPDREALPDER